MMPAATTARMPNHFQALRVRQQAQQISTTLEQLSTTDLPAGDVLIEAHYSSVNFKDALAATGAGSIIKTFPRTAGIDVAGYVLSAKNSSFQAGDPVIVTGYDLGTTHDGGYAELVQVPSEWVIPLPAGLSLYTAMALGTAGLTVALCIKRLQDNGQDPANGPIIVTGASGGVGCLAINILSKLGYTVIAVTGKKDMCAQLRKFGASSIMQRQDLSLEAPPLAQGQWGGAIDNVGGAMLSWLTKTVRPWGNIVSVGMAGGSELNTTVMPFILRGVSLLGVSSANCPTPLRHQLWQRLASDLMPQQLAQIVSGKVTLNELSAVFQRMLAGETIGRTVVDLRPA